MTPDYTDYTDYTDHLDRLGDAYADAKANAEMTIEARLDYALYRNELRMAENNKQLRRMECYTNFNTDT